MSDKMIKRLIEVRIQNIIDLDIAKNKQLAIKTKGLNSKLQQHDRTIEQKKLEHFEKTQIYEETINTVNEHNELLEAVHGEITQLKQQIQRLKKKSAETLSYKPSCRLSGDDRNIHVKKELKLRILNHVTKIFLAEKKSSNRLRGYVTKKNEFIPFEMKCTSSSPNATNAEELWKSISASSEHQSEWDALVFADEASDSYKNSTF